MLFWPLTNACCFGRSPMHVLAKLQMDEGPCKEAQQGTQRLAAVGQQLDTAVLLLLLLLLLRQLRGR
jgi:hypothetical protein